MQVTLHDGSTHDAEVIGVDAPERRGGRPRPDRVFEKLAPVALGEICVKAPGRQEDPGPGNPFGLERMLTTGIISAASTVRSAPRMGG